ncbi:MAG: hypothetical protein ABJJ69_03295 [Paracoccaceae bacterium]
MTSFTLSVDDVRLGTGWGHHRIRTILTTPYCLPFEKADAGPTGGAKKRLFRLDDILVRCRHKPSFTEQSEQNLIRADQQKRFKKEQI